MWRDLLQKLRGLSEMLQRHRSLLLLRTNNMRFSPSNLESFLLRRAESFSFSLYGSEGASLLRRRDHFPSQSQLLPVRHEAPLFFLFPDRHSYHGSPLSSTKSIIK